ncbi:Tetratricopeptide repeat protein 14 [Thelohanellus kitauei]|uniref:Tetratricopeptide repeat protein 14 n=1 Tax=Thelohanellus kitauei TaxID=669202 RepID=A0A0C2JJB7_THEKT|nr:Tetratricopeptide repeat protein 14 [Thelohanellus kitauei]
MTVHQYGNARGKSSSKIIEESALRKFKKLVENARKKLDRKLDSDELHTGKNIPETREFSILSCPLEHYLQFSDEYRLAKLNDVSLVLSRVSSIGSNWVILDPIHVQGKRNRKIYDLDLEIHIPILDFHKELPKESDFLRAVVTSTTYKQEKYKIFASVNKSLVPSSISLGPYDISQISENLLAYHRLPKSDPSVLRDKQFDDYAAQLTSSAIKKIHACEYQEAEKKLNDALSFSPENVDAIVALGACAIKIFTSALEINPTHKNALNYLVEAGLSEAKINEDWLEASKCYQNILNVTYIKNSPDLLNKITQSLNESLRTFQLR